MIACAKFCVVYLALLNLPDVKPETDLEFYRRSEKLKRVKDFLHKKWKIYYNKLQFTLFLMMSQNFKCFYVSIEKRKSNQKL